MNFTAILKQHKHKFKSVVPFTKGVDKIFNIKLCDAELNVPKHLQAADDNLSPWLYNHLQTIGAKYAVGGYNEIRSAYAKASLFSGTTQPRRLHIGVDVFAPAGTPIYLPLQGKIHSYANNNSYGNYGPTIIFKHKLNGYNFYTLYGHNSLASINIWEQLGTNNIEAGTCIGYMGSHVENVGWSPHLHFQIIINMQGQQGDYYGVCAPTEAEFYLNNCPDGNLILNML